MLLLSRVQISLAKQTAVHMSYMCSHNNMMINAEVVTVLISMIANSKLTHLMLEMEYSCFRDQYHAFWCSLLKSPEHQLAWYWLYRTDQHYAFLFQSLFHQLGSSQIQDTIQNEITSFVIFKTIQHITS